MAKQISALTLATLIVGSNSEKTLKMLITNLANMGDATPSKNGQRDPECVAAITKLKQGYASWTGETWDN